MGGGWNPDVFAAGLGSERPNTSPRLELFTPLGIDFADAATQVIVEIAAGDASRVAGAVEQAVDHDLFGEIGRSGDLGLNRHAFVRRFEPGSAHALVAVNIDGDLLGCGLGSTGGRVTWPLALVTAMTAPCCGW